MALQPLPPPSQELVQKDQWFYLLWAAVDYLVKEVIRDETPTTVTTSTSMDDTSGFYVVTTTGLTLTLPAASTARIGKEWTVNLSVAGLVTVQRAGSDTIMTVTSATDTSVIINTRGDSLTFKCASASTWVIV